jgi:hypothetical protein
MKYFSIFEIAILKRKVVTILLIAKTLHIPDIGRDCWKSLDNYNLIKRINFAIV